MRRTSWMALALGVAYGFTVCSVASAAESANGANLQRLLFTRLLLDGDPATSRLGARSISQLPNGAAKQSLSDLAAERLIALAAPDPTIDSATADLIAWHVNALATNIGRYRPILRDARQRIGHPKLQQRIDLALQSAEAVPVEQYRIRNIDFAAVKADADQQWAANRRRDRSQFAKMQTGSSLDAVLGALGSPDDVTPTAMRVAKYGRTQMLTLHYAQSGMVLFKLDGTDVRDWKAFEFVDELFDITVTYVGKQFGLAQGIAGFRGSRFRDYMIYNAGAIRQSAEFLPILEQRLVSVTEPADKLERDGMLRCVGLIYWHGGPDAIEALHRIERASTDARVQKDARAYALKLKQRPAGKTEPPEESSDDEAAQDNAA
jgi:hypothetical protein